MKTIMISVKPEYAEQIMNGKKTIEVRKFSIEPPFKVLGYVMQEKPYVKDFAKYNAEFCKGKNCDRFLSFNEQYNNNRTINGKVAFEYVVNKVTNITHKGFVNPEFLEQELFQKSCLSTEEFFKYSDNYKKDLYGFHISDLIIYDKPKELREFYMIDKDAVKNCEERERIYNNPENTNGALLLGSYICNSSGDWCKKCKLKPITKPPQNFVYCEVQNDT